MDTIANLSRRYRITRGDRFRLKDINPDDSSDLDLKKESEALLAQSVKRMSELQDRLYAQDRWAVLLRELRAARAAIVNEDSPKRRR